MIATALTIAGSDSGGGAGIQADLKTFTVLKVYGASVITAVTAQNTQGVAGIYWLSPDFVGLQLDAVLSDIGFKAVKTGMLGNAATLDLICEKLKAHRVNNLVVDPVMAAKRGEQLFPRESLEIFLNKLLPLTSVITPNLDEAEALTGLRITTEAEMQQAARAIFDYGVRYVVLKGGHLPGAESVDFLFDGQNCTRFATPRMQTKNTHGTGCTFAAALAAYLAKGRSVEEAVTASKHFITTAIQHGLPLGKGYGPVNHLAPYLENEL